MTAKPRRATYRHGNLKAAALKAATRLVAKAGHEQLSLREVADAVGVAHARSTIISNTARRSWMPWPPTPTPARRPIDESADAARLHGDLCAFRARQPRALCADDQPPHATMKHNRRCSARFTSASPRRCGFLREVETPAARRRAVMKIYLTLYAAFRSMRPACSTSPARRR